MATLNRLRRGNTMGGMWREAIRFVAGSLLAVLFATAAVAAFLGTVILATDAVHINRQRWPV